MTRTSILILLGAWALACGAEDDSSRDEATGGSGGSSGASGTSGTSGAPGTGGTTYSPETTSIWQDFCELRATRATECGMTEESCPDAACLARIYDEQALREYVQCQSAKGCDSFYNDDDCFVEAGTLGPDREAFAERCMARISECGSDSAEYCASAAPIVRSAIMDAVSACLARPCSELDTCLSAVEIPNCWE